MQEWENLVHKRRNYLFIWFLAISLFFHAFLFFFNPPLQFSTLNQSKSEKKKKYISIRTILRPKKELAKINLKNKQIVKTSKSNIQKLDPKTRFLGAKTQVVEKESRAKRVAAFSEASRGLKHGEKKRAPISKKLAQKQKKILKTLTFDKLAAMNNQIQTEGMKEVYSPSAVALGERSGSSHKSGLNQNNDFVEDVPMGDMTYLNTVEYKYFGFYDRIRKKLEIHWGSTLKAKTDLFFKSGRRMPASENILTSLVVVLNSKGSIVDVVVRGSSGFQVLDDAAIESFNKAGPFPNPPQGMLENGRAKIRWGFVVNNV